MGMVCGPLGRRPHIGSHTGAHGKVAYGNRLNLMVGPFRNC